MKNNKLTILTPYFPTKANKYGGIFVYDQIKVLADLVEQVEVYVTRPWFKISRKFPFIEISRDDLALINIELANVTLKLIRYFPFPKDSIFYHVSLAVSIFLNKNKFSEKLLVHTVYPVGAAVNFAKLNPTIVVHGSDYRYFSGNKNQQKSIIKTINRLQIVTVSKGLKQEIESIDEINTSKLEVIENGIMLSNLKYLQKEETLRDSIFSFVFVGSLIKLKGVYELLYAFSELQKNTTYQRYSLTFVGDGIERKGLEALASKLHAKNVSFLGAIENSKVSEVLNKKDCLVLPSYQEGFGRVIIEMFSFGKPVISTTSGGPEYIINDDNGLIVPPKDIQALSSAMSQICLNFANYKPEKIIKYVNENYNLVSQTIKLLDYVAMDVK
ncbi:glycosyltransferase [Pseudoalteromonas prydzensis]|uniref:glycosyltransferase n=1 Tax=Pseudoalteromonas prydzensis TaxID=182141 RepID=UPI0007E5168D|nr:glycosyltransferase [Pseudoalteromonas prydzensis]MBE0376711.1 rhamnosyltransferase [Pseudoalteromonas prydzensis ACAM 620]